tara:strand:+ start:324 stop:1256 length:933 start_codon:yes stop_codon:yes gene_type:complete
MNRNYDFKDQELDLKMRIKFLNKKLREPDHGVEQYEEWESNLEIVTDELTKLQVKKFKSFLSKWIHVYKKDNQLINVVDCMFVSLEEDQQTDMATKWYHRRVKEKDIRHYQLLAQYTKEENQNLKKRLKALQKGGDKEIKLLRKEIKTKVKQATNQRLLEFRKKEAQFKEQKKEAIKQSRESISNNYDKLLRQHVMELNHYKNKIEEQERFIKNLDKGDVFFDLQNSVTKLEEKNYELIGKLQQEKSFKEDCILQMQTEIERLRESKNKILDEFKKMQISAMENSESENRTILELQDKILQLTEKQKIKQ